MSIITATNISKTYQRGREEVCALRGVDLEIDAGDLSPSSARPAPARPRS